MSDKNDFDAGTGTGFRLRPGQKQKAKLTQKQQLALKQRQKAKRVAKTHARNMALERSALDLAGVVDSYLKVMGLRGLRTYQEFNEDWERRHFDELHDEVSDPSTYRDKADMATLLRAQLEKLGSKTEVDARALEAILQNLHGLNLELD